MIYPRISRRQIATALLASYLLGPVSAFAQVVLNAGTPNDGRRAYVDRTQNGLPKVNIATPNGAGVSHNVYQELNVGKQGLILNNAANNSNTSLAGWVEGNPNLKPGNEAKMILNEVVGANPSQLQGFVEVAGKKADVIITNENGVACNGCGFINTSRVTLSTGTPMWGSIGQLDGLKIRQGLVSIGGDGLSAPDSRVDLLSQAINIQGDVHADSLNLIAGGNDIRYGDLSLSKLPDIRGGMDIEALGGMYANQIQLVATGTGVGVRVDGTLVSAGNVSITSDGQLTHTGKTSAQNNIQITAQQITQSASVLATGTLDITAQSLANTGTLVGQDLTIQANVINNAGSVSANRSMALEADKLVQSGTLVSKGTLTASQLSSLENSGTLGGQTLDVTADKVLNLGVGTVASSAAATLHATTLNNLGRIHTEGQATFDARRVNNAGVIEAVGGLSINQAWTVQNTGTLSGTDVAINTQALSNAGRLQADLLTLLAYQDSGIPSADRLTQTAVVNSGVMAADRMAITGYANVTNTNQISTDITTKGQASDSGNLRIQAGTLDNTGGSLLAKNKLTIDAGNVYNNRATLSSKGDMGLTASGNLDNGAGLILHQGSGSAQVQAGLALNNAKGQIEGQGQSLRVSAGDIDNSQGQIVQTKASTGPQPASLNVSAQTVANTTSQGQLVNIKGNISSTGNTTITANSVVTDTSSAQLSGASSLSFLDKTKISSGASTATGGYNWNTDIAASNAVTQAQNAADQANAQAQAAATALQTAQTNLASVQANAASTPAAIAQAQSAVTAAQTANTAAQAAATAAAQQLADAQAAVPAVNAGTTGSSITQPNGKPVDLTVPNAPAIVLSAPASQIQAGNDLTLNVGTVLFDNHQGSLAAARNLTVNAQGDVLAGQMTAGGALSVTAKQLEVAQQIRGKTASVTANALVVTGRVQGDDSLNIKADSITNSGTLTGKAVVLQGRSSDTSLTLGNTGMVQGNQSLTIQADKVLNQATLVSGGDITTQTQYLENKALIYSGGSQNHYGVELVNNAGRLYAMGDITIQGNTAGDNAQSLLNYIGRIEAQGDINLKANTITNHAVVPTVNARGVVEKSVTPTLITTTAKDTFNADGKSSEILAGRNLNIKADTLLNEYGIISAHLNANIGTRLLTNRAYGAIQTQNYVVKAACFNCHQTVSYSETWGGVIAAGGTATVTASEKLDNKTIDTRDGFAGLSTDPRVVIVDERSNTASPLTQAFKDRFGIVNGPANSAAGTAPSLNLGSSKALSDGLVLNPNGTFDFSHYTVPNGQTGLFEKAPATSPYLIRGRSDLFAPASNDQYTSYNKFAGSDYLLTRLGLMPGGIKLLGDAWYETQLVQDQMYALKGRTHLVAGTDNDYDLMMGLMDAGLLAQAQFGFGLGDTLTPAQQAALTQDMVWPEWQVVDGQKVLVPKLYVAHQTQNNDNNKGARIVGTDVVITTRELENTGTLAASKSLAINASGKVSGGGSYSGGKAVAIVASNVDLKSASIQSGGWLNIDTVGDMTLTSTQIKAAGDASLTAGGALSLKAQEFNTRVVRGDGTSRTETKYETSNLEAGGTVVLSAKKDLTLEGAQVNAGNNLLAESREGNVNLVARKETSDYNYKGAGALAEIQAREKAASGTQQDPATSVAEVVGNTQVHEERLQNVRLTPKGNATIQAHQGDIKADALNVNAGNDVTINGGQVNLNHTTANAGRDISVQATDGNATLKAVDMQADRNFELSSVGNAAIVSDAITAANGSIAQVSSRIKVGNQANVTALGDLTVQGGDVQAKDINLTALGNVTLTGAQNKAVYGGSNDTTTLTTTQSLNLKGNNINIQGVGQSSDVTLVAANVDAAKKAKIAGSGNVTIASGENRSTHEATTQNEDCNWYGKCTTTVTRSVQDQTTQVGSNIKGGAVDINAGKNLTAVASTIESSGSVNLTAQGAIDYQAALNVNKNDVQSNSSSSWFGIDTSWLSVLGGGKQTNDSNIQTRAATTQLQSEADILSESGGNTRLQGTQIKAQNFTANVGVGPSADPSAKIIIEGVKETLQSSRTEKSESLVWQAQSGQGKTEQTLAQTNIQATTKFSAPGGIDVQLPAGDPLKQQIQSLSQQSGMAWLNDLSQRKDVNWQEIKLAKDKWDYSQEGLTQTGAIMIAIAVTIATQGTGTSLVGTTSEGAVAGSSTTAAGGTTLATTTGGVTTYTAEGAALNAGYTSLMSQAAVTLANNKGDVGKTMQDMGKSDNIKSIVTSAVTAGALQSVNPDWMKQLSNTGQFTDKAVINLTNAAVSAMIKTAIQGGSYEDNLTASLKTGGVDTVAGWAASNVGQGYKNGDGALSDLQGQYIAHKVAHALVGCASAMAKDSGCAAGALGGAVGEAFAEMYGQSQYGTADGATLTAAQQQEVLNMSKLVTAAVAGMTGKDAQAAVDAAQNAVLNNWLFVSEEKALKAAKAACQGAESYSDACQKQAGLEALDARRDAISKPLEASCAGGKAGACELAQAYRVDQLTNALGQAEFTWDELETLIRATTGVVTAESKGNPMAINAQTNKDGSYKTDEKGNLVVNLINGKPDGGGLSYGLVQFSSQKGGMQDFLNFLQSNSGISSDAKMAYDTLINAGGLTGAKDGTPAFVQAWQGLTKDPQFQIYQLEAAVRGGNMKNVEGYFQSLGINISDLESAKQEVVVAMVVQRAKLTKQEVTAAFLSVSQDSQKIYDGLINNGAIDRSYDLAKTLKKSEDMIGVAKNQLIDAEAARANAEAARANAALRVIELQDQASGATDMATARQALSQATSELAAATQKTEEANQRVFDAHQNLMQKGDQAQTIRDEWKAFFVDNAFSKDASGKTITSESMQALLAAVKKVDPGRSVTLEKVIKKLYPVTP